ncbi:MAG TPA: serine hydrolase domain-containing protein [Xanthobacteraceae bacterium]|nr:serine hydrolase domain-containing protein [Xanthobacteraceae bacterium]
MTIRPLAAFALALTIAATPARAEESLSTLLEPVRNQYGLPALAAAVAKNGHTVAAGAVGTRVLGRDIPVTLDDRFHIGSDTKAMTATLAAMLVEEGRLRWESTIGEVLGAELPGLHPKFADITLERLLSHTGGIPTDTREIYELYISGDAYEETLPGSRLRLLRAYGKHEPVVKADAPFQYSNLGYIAAGAMIEKAAGESWEQLIFERLFVPLGLKTAGLGPQATMGRLDAPVGHDVDENGKVTPRPWGPGADVPPVLGPAGVGHMSIRDFVRWGAWNAGEGKRGPALVKPATLKRLHRQVVEMKIENPPPGTPTSGGYALGWGLVAHPWTGNRPVLVHNGSNSLNLATILVDPPNDLAIAIATNFPGKRADAALRKLTQALYERYGPRSR